MSRYNTTFLGAEQQHNYALHQRIDEILLSRPEIKNFVEIGSGNAALTVILGLHAFVRKGNCITFELQLRPGYIRLAEVLRQLNVITVLGSCFSLPGLIRTYCQEPCFVFCDGDDKPRQLATFAPHLLPGSIVACHDLGHEFELKDIEETVTTLGLVPVLESAWQEVQTCFYTKKANKDDE
jgi:hypothetical protein